jgi:hypothetical protein
MRFFHAIVLPREAGFSNAGGRLKRAAVLAAAGLLAGGAGGLAEAQSASPGPENYHFRVEGFTWSGDIEGQIQKGFGDGPGTLLDLENDLGLAASRTYGFSAAIKLGSSWKLRGSFTPFDYPGDVMANQNFSFGDDDYFVGERVVTTVQGKYYTGALEWDFVRKPQGYFGIFVGAKVLDGDFVIVSPGTGKRDVESGVAPAPVVGIASRLYAGRRFSTEFEYSGMWFGDRGKVSETIFALRFHLSDRLAAMGGYRRVSIEGHPTEERDLVVVKLSGIVFGVELSL